MFKISPGAPVSNMKFPSVESILAFITMRFPARVNGIMLDAGSLVTTGSPTKSSLKLNLTVAGVGSTLVDTTFRLPLLKAKRNKNG